MTEDEEVALAVDATGGKGYALADLAYSKGHGGQMLVGLLGRTVASPDAINTVSVVVTNGEATYLLKRSQDFAPTEFWELVTLAQQGALTELYQRSRAIRRPMWMLSFMSVSINRGRSAKRSVYSAPNLCPNCSWLISTNISPQRRKARRVADGANEPIGA